MGTRAIFLLGGIADLTDGEWAGIFFLLCSCLVLPPARSFMYSKLSFLQKIKYPNLVRWVSIFIILGITGKYTPDKNDKVIEYFRENRTQIIKSVQESYESQKYENVIQNYKKYTVANDPVLNDILSKSEAIIAQKEKADLDAKKKQEIAEQTAVILSDLTKVPSHEFQINKDLYQKLLELNPDTKKYQDKVDFYSKKIDAQLAKNKAAEQRKKLIKSQFSSWDGSHIQLTKMIKETMNDPDSYKHDKTVYWDKGDHIIVKTIFRGRNAFGGIVKNSVRAKFDLNGQIIDILGYND